MNSADVTAPLTPRVRMFAGPNGSGKSTIKAQIEARLWGHYINPDEIEAQIRRDGFFDFALWNLPDSAAQILPFFAASTWLQNAGRGEMVRSIFLSGTRLDFSRAGIDSYLSSVLADFLRRQLLAKRENFTFETVMSARDKVNFLSHARTFGYRTYLYYICTDDARINISRVQNRVALGGHPVPEAKIVERYVRSLSLLLDAIRASDRAYLFDNSGAEAVHFADFAAGHLTIRASPQPLWFQTYVLDKLTATSETA